MAAEQPGQTLQATALVHEAYLRLVGGGQPQEWSGRGHFFAAAAEAMRRILVEQARRKGHTIWALFPANTTYFGKRGSSFMVNYRVKDLDAVLAALRREGAKVDPKVEDFPYGRFAWIVDLDGNRVELWEPPALG